MPEPIDVDFLATPCPRGVEVEIENIRGARMKCDLIGQNLATGIAHVYVVFTGKTVVDMADFADRLTCTALDQKNMKVRVRIKDP